MQRVLLFLALLVAIGGRAYAQPANDNCASAKVVAIPSGGYGLGTFVPDTVNMTGATVVAAEPMHPTQLFSGNDKRSVWYKFTIPTARAVRLTLAQPGTAIPQDAVGFTVYKTTTCPTDLSSVEAAKLTPINKFGNSYNPCLAPGTYYVQITSKLSVQDLLFISLDVQYPTLLTQYDLTTGAYNFGTVSGTGMSPVVYDIGCQTLDDAAETCPALASGNFTQSTWHVFRTDSWVDWMAMEVGKNSWDGTPLPFGFRLLQGDVRVSAPGGLPVIDGCDSLGQSGSAPARVYYPCVLQPNTTYSIQVFWHKDQQATVRLKLEELGGQITVAPNPSTIPPAAPNRMGVLAGSTGGTWYTANDYFACNALMSANICGTVQPGTAFGERDLATWFTFELSQPANLTFNSGGCSDVNNRLYSGDVSTDGCNLAMYRSWGNSQQMLCVPAGKYSLQVLGTRGGDNVEDCNLSNLGKLTSANINVQSVPTSNRYDLEMTGAYDTVNKVLGVQQPMPEGITLTTTFDRMGCEHTVLPAGDLCSGSKRKAIYRHILVGDADGNGTADNGILSISGGNWQHFDYRLYRGDANAQAQAQAANVYPETITGLTDQIGCQSLYYTARYCVTPGIYTLVSLGDSFKVSIGDNPRLRLDFATTKYSSPNAPNNMGNITVALLGGATVGSDLDVFSCVDNPLTIANRAPCTGTTKQIYREFYLAEPMAISISVGGAGVFRLFSGRVSQGIGGLTPYTDASSGEWSCLRSRGANVCTPLPAGWYTVVTYGSGKTWASPTYTTGYGDDIGLSTFIEVRRIPPPQNPRYNRPYKAYNAGNITWGPNAGTAAIPRVDRVYTLGTENFNCINDLPWSGHPISPCTGNQYNRVAYYVFRLTQESFIKVMGIPASMRHQLYARDVRTDSLLFPTTTPLESCKSLETDIDNGYYQYCRMQPGVYTLAVYATNSHIGGSLTPSIYIDDLPGSRFDNAASAYDFGLLPSDSTQYLGKPGDVNPLNASRAASNDFFDCRTSAFWGEPTSPSTMPKCNIGGYPTSGQPSVPQPTPANYYLQPGLPGNTPIVRRTLWYSFVVNGPGKVHVSVYNRTPGHQGITRQAPFAIYKSDADGNIDYATLVATGQVDSTEAQGLTFVTNNSIYFPGSLVCTPYNRETVTFDRSPCDPVTTDRYYIIVDNHYTNIPNHQVEVGLRFDPIAFIPVKYDHVPDANLIGYNEADPPYTATPLGAGTYTGTSALFACATRDVTDQFTLENDACADQTLWWKFTAGITGKVRIQYSITDGAQALTDTRNMQLFRELSPGVLTPAAFPMIPTTAVTSGGSTWREACVYPGTYYIMLTGCDYNLEYAAPRIQLERQDGDYCGQPQDINLNTLNASGHGTASGTLRVDCHTIGEDFGEDGGNMTCLFGPTGYKSSWYRINLSTGRKVDLTFRLSESTTALPNQIRYRVNYGSCGAMTSGPCNTDGLTEFTLNCMQDGTYYVQVVSPVSAVGLMTMQVLADTSLDTTCIPLDPLVPLANFAGGGCQGGDVAFTNLSSAGDDITYRWTALPNGGTGYAGEVSTAFVPDFNFPIVATASTYTVELIVTNTAAVPNRADTLTQTITVYPPPLANITRDAPYNGATVPFSIPVQFRSNPTNTVVAPATTYLWTWRDGSTSTLANPTKTFVIPTDMGNHIVSLRVTNGTCTETVYDTFVVDLEAIYVGGPYDGGDDLGANTFCPEIPMEWSGGPYDGGSYDTDDQACPEEEFLYAGGPYDGGDRYNVPSECVLPDTICQGESVWVVAPVSGTSYSWSTGSVNDSIFVAPSVTTSYFVTVDATVFEMVVVVIPFAATVDAGPDIYVCSPQLRQIGTPGTSGYVYSWAPSAGLSDANIAQPYANPAVTTTYTLTIASSTCVATDSMTYYVDNLATSKSPDVTKCPADLAHLEITASPGMQTYWLPDTVGPATHLVGWKYRKPLTINNTGTAQTGYQVRLTLNTAAMVTDGKLQNTCADLRFTLANGVTTVPYWIESGCNTATTVVWLRIPSLPAGNTQLYLYYNNIIAPAVTSASSVFEFYDNFDDGSINGTLWETGTVGPAAAGTDFTESAGHLRGGNSLRYIRSRMSFTGNYEAVTRVRVSVEAGNGFTTNGFYGSATNGYSTLDHNTETFYRNDNAWSGGFAYNPVNVYVRETVRVVGTAGSVTRFNESTSATDSRTHTNSGISGERLRLGARGDDAQFGATGQNFTAIWDWIYVRKAMTAEPTGTLSVAEQRLFYKDGTVLDTTANGTFVAVTVGQFCTNYDTIRVTSNDGTALHYRSDQNGDWTNLTTWEVALDPIAGPWTKAELGGPCGAYPFPTHLSRTVQVSHYVVYDSSITIGVDEVTIHPTGTLYIPKTKQLYLVDSSNAYTTVAADIYNNGRLDIAGLFTPVGAGLLVNTDPSTVAYTCDCDQTMWNGQYGRLEADNGGIKTVGGGATLVRTEVEFILGYIRLNNRNLTLDTNAVVTNPGESSGYFVTNLQGEVVKRNIGPGGSASFFFPIGHSTTSYNPALLIELNSLDAFGMRVSGVFEYDPVFGNDELVRSNSADRTWYVNEINSPNNGEFSLEVDWDTAHENAGFDRSQSTMGWYNPATGWTRMGATGPATAVAGQDWQWAYTGSTTYTEGGAFTVGSCTITPLDYRTIADGVWTNVNIWEVWEPVRMEWIPAYTINSGDCGFVKYPTALSRTINVRHNVVYDYTIPVGVDQVNVEAQAVLTVPDTAHLKLYHGTGSNFPAADNGRDMNLFGKFIITGAFNVYSGGLLVCNDASIVHYNGTDQPLWNGSYSHLWLDGPQANAANIKSVTNDPTGSLTQVRDGLQFINGKMLLGSLNCYLLDRCVVAGAGQNTGYMIADQDGYCVWDYLAGTMRGHNFPLGGDWYSPCILTFDNVTVAGDMYGRLREYTHPNWPQAIRRFWTLTKGSLSFAASGYTLELNYVDRDLPYVPANDADEVPMVIIGGMYSPAYTTPGNWRFSQGQLGHSLQVDRNKGFLRNTAFSDATLGPEEATLPVANLKLQGRWVGRNALLDWGVDREQNNFGYDLQRSEDGLYFQSVNFQLGAGNTLVAQHYRYLDQEVADMQPDHYYYRVRQLDLDGSVSYSNTVELQRTPITATELRVYPNPVSTGSALQIEFVAVNEDNATLVLTDMLGRTIYTAQYAAARGPNLWQMPTSAIAQGTYTLTVSSGSVVAHKKIVIIHK